MSQISIIGLDIAKHVFQAHGVDSSGHVVLRKKISRAKLLPFFAARPPCRVALANKTARIVWAVLAKNEDYRVPAVAASVRV